MTEFSKLSRFGMTYKPLTDILGEGLSMSLVVDFHVKTFQPPGREPELMESEVACGEKWHASFTKYDPNTCSWKTHQCSLLGDLDEFLETWPAWGLMRDGECWEQRTLEQNIRGTGFGLSPDGKATFHTPNTTGLDGGSNSRKALHKRQMVPTPTSSMMPCEGTVRIMRKAWESGEFTLEEASAIAGRDVRKSQGKVPAMDKFPTPQATDYRDKPTSASWKAKGAMNYSLANPEIQAKWPTPKCSDSRHAISRHITDPEGMWKGNLGEVVMSTLEPTTGRLNPTWVEWLMGWPLEWTDLKPLEMDKSPSVQQPLGES
jgi:DNA (cytosine-5)-methyltransferase 1